MLTLLNKVKPALSCHSKIDKTKVLKTNGSLMKVKSIAKVCNTFILHYAIVCIENQFWDFFLSDSLCRFYCT